MGTAKLMTPLFYDGNYNVEKKRMRAVLEREVSNGAVSYRLWRSDGKPDLEYPRAANDSYILHVEVNHLLSLAVPFFTESAILFFLLGLPLERFLLLIRTILCSQRKACRDLLQNECSNEVGETLAVAFFRIKECGDMLI